MSQKKSPKSSKSVEARLEALSSRQDKIDKAIQRVEQQLSKLTTQPAKPVRTESPENDDFLTPCCVKPKKGHVTLELDGYHSETIARLSEECVQKGLNCTFKIVPSDYYQRKMEERRAILAAPAVEYLCKSIVMINSRWQPQEGNIYNSRYYCVVIQYAAKLNSEKMVKFFHQQNQSSGNKISKKCFNYRLLDEQVNDELTGFQHNAVTPVGIRTRIPILMSHKIAELDHFWLGGGEVDIKLKVDTKEFIDAYQPIIADITYDGVVVTDALD